MDKQSNSTIASTVSIPDVREAIPNDDQIMAIARALGDAERRRQDAELKSKNPDDGVRRSYKIEEDHASDLTYALRNMLSQYAATSLDGAAVQVAELINLVDLLWDRIPEDTIDYRMKEDHRAIERLLYSVLDCLNGRLALPVEEFVYRHFTNSHVNPWTPLAERFAMRGLNEEASS